MAARHAILCGGGGRQSSRGSFIFHGAILSNQLFIFNQVDSLNGSHPIEVQCTGNPDFIEEIFDEIS